MATLSTAVVEDIQPSLKKARTFATVAASSTTPKESTKDNLVEIEVQPAEARMDGDLIPIGNGVALIDTKLLDCPFCKQPFGSPSIYMCSAPNGCGTLVCDSCYTDTGPRCPRCYVHIAYTCCDPMEKIVKSAKIPCPNRQHGCMELISYSKKLEHEKTCKYVFCLCPHFSCGYTATPEKLYAHYAEKHFHGWSKSFIFNTSTFIDLSSSGQKYVILQEEKEKVLFVLNRFTLPAGSLINVVCLAPAGKKESFCWEIKVEKGKCLINSSTFVDCSQKWTEEKAPEKNCFLIPSEFNGLDGSIFFELTISKL